MSRIDTAAPVRSLHPLAEVGAALVGAAIVLALIPPAVSVARSAVYRRRVAGGVR